MKLIEDRIVFEDQDKEFKSECRVVFRNADRIMSAAGVFKDLEKAVNNNCGKIFSDLREKMNCDDIDIPKESTGIEWVDEKEEFRFKTEQPSKGLENFIEKMVEKLGGKVIDLDGKVVNELLNSLKEVATKEKSL